MTQGEKCQEGQLSRKGQGRADGSGGVIGGASCFTMVIDNFVLQAKN
jgi:hypothetical protein